MHATARWSRTEGSGVRVLRGAGLGLGAAVVAGHAALFAERLRDATLAEPAVALRWALSGLLVAAAAVAQRRLDAATRRRAAGVLSLAALALHFGGPSPAGVADPLAALIATLPTGLIVGAAGALRHRGPRLAARREGERCLPPRRLAPIAIGRSRATARALPRPPPIA